jgi:hypothetical protein
MVEIIGPIRQELLSGVRDQIQFDQLETHLTAFADLQLLAEDYVTAAKFFNLCRSKGIQGSNAAFLICSVAVRGMIWLCSPQTATSPSLPSACRLSCMAPESPPSQHLHVIVAPAPKREVWHSQRRTVGASVRLTGGPGRASRPGSE